MSNEITDIDTNYRTYHFFNDVFNIKKFDPNNIKTGKNHTKIFFFTILDMKRSRIQNI